MTAPQPKRALQSSRPTSLTRKCFAITKNSLNNKASFYFKLSAIEPTSLRTDHINSGHPEADWIILWKWFTKQDHDLRCFFTISNPLPSVAKLILTYDTTADLQVIRNKISLLLISTNIICFKQYTSHSKQQNNCYLQH